MLTESLTKCNARRVFESRRYRGAGVALSGRSGGGQAAAHLQFLSRYPVLNIHATNPRQITKNPIVINMLMPTLTSAAP